MDDPKSPRVDLQPESEHGDLPRQTATGDAPGRVTPTPLTWCGWKPESMPSAWALLRAVNLPALDDNDSLLRFFDGDQWPADVLDARQKAHQPTLVINQLPVLLAAALDADRRAGFPPMIDITSVKRIIAYYNRDAQMLYNVHASAIAEPPRLFYESATGVRP